MPNLRNAFVFFVLRAFCLNSYLCLVFANIVVVSSGLRFIAVSVLSKIKTGRCWVNLIITPVN